MALVVSLLSHTLRMRNIFNHKTKMHLPRQHECFFYENHCVCLTAVTVGYHHPPPSACRPCNYLYARNLSHLRLSYFQLQHITVPACAIFCSRQQCPYTLHKQRQRVDVCTCQGSAGYLLAEQAHLSPCALPLLPLLLVFLHLLHIAAACRRYCWPANTLFRLIYWLAAAAGGQRSCHTHTQHTVLQGRVERDNSNCCIMYVGCTERGACLLVCQRQQQQQQQ